MAPRPKLISPYAVLVVDDNAVNLAVARSMVARLGFAVKTASNGREALEAAKAGPCAAVLMDVMMPEMDGLEATRDHRAHAAERSQHDRRA